MGDFEIFGEGGLFVPVSRELRFKAGGDQMTVGRVDRGGMRKEGWEVENVERIQARGC